MVSEVQITTAYPWEIGFDALKICLYNVSSLVQTEKYFKNIKIPSAFSCEVGSHFVLISTAHPWEVSYDALLLSVYPQKV